MRACLTVLTLILVGFPFAPAFAEEAAFHHVHLNVPNPEDGAQWYIRHMGCEAVPSRQDAAQCGAVQLHFSQRPPTGGTVGTAVHHIGFSFPNVDGKMAELAAAGVKIVRPAQPGKLKVGWVEDPWATRIEAVEDPESVGLYHVHLHVHAADPTTVLKWYQSAFGGQLLKRKMTGLDGLLFGKLWILAQKAVPEELPLQPTEGHPVDHLGFSVADLDAAVAALKAKGIPMQGEVRTVKDPAGKTAKIASLVGPDDVLIQLVQPPSQ